MHECKLTIVWSDDMNTGSSQSYAYKLMKTACSCLKSILPHIWFPSTLLVDIRCARQRNTQECVQAVYNCKPCKLAAGVASLLFHLPLELPVTHGTLSGFWNVIYFSSHAHLHTLNPLPDTFMAFVKQMMSSRGSWSRVCSLWASSYPMQYVETMHIQWGKC